MPTSCSVDVGTLHRSENRPMSKQQLVNLGWNSGDMNVHAKLGQQKLLTSAM